MSTALTGIFNNGVAGMMAFTQAIGGVSDNIANQNTVGYKRVESDFRTVMGQTDRVVKNGSGSSVLQGRNTAGVQVSTRALVETQGAIQTTNRALDLAISGNGMFIFGNGQTDGTAITIDSYVYGRAGNLDDFIPMTVEADTVVPDTRAFLVNTNGQFLLAQPITAADLLVDPPVAPTSLAELEPIQVSDQDPFAGLATATAELAAVIPASGATTVSTPLFFIDNNGDQQGLTLTFSNPVVVSGTSTTWDVSIIDSTGVPSGTLTTVTFDNNGQLPLNSTVSLTDNGTTFTLDISAVAMLGDSTSGTSAQAVQVGYEQDGVPAGAFEGLTFREDGVVFGKYSGGATQPLYRIPLASFANPNALEPLAGNVYQLTEEAGELTFRLFGDEFSKLVINAVETSNADLADSFAQMIIYQRAYGSSAKVVQTADEMSATVRDLMR